MRAHRNSGDQMWPQKKNKCRDGRIFHWNIAASVSDTSWFACSNWLLWVCRQRQPLEFYIADVHINFEDEGGSDLIRSSKIIVFTLHTSGLFGQVIGYHHPWIWGVQTGLFKYQIKLTTHASGSLVAWSERCYSCFLVWNKYFSLWQKFILCRNPLCNVRNLK